MKDIIDLLTTDHRSVKAALKKLRPGKAPGREEQASAFAELAHSVTVHTSFEEEAVYPLLLPVRKSKHLAYEAYEEHKQAKVLLADLALETTGSEVWNAKIAVLGEGLQHHIREEEGSLLPALRKIANQDILNALAEKYSALKKSSHP